MSQIAMFKLCLKVDLTLLKNNRVGQKLHKSINRTVDLKSLKLQGCIKNNFIYIDLKVDLTNLKGNYETN